MVLYESAGILGQIITAMNTQTGSLFITLLILTIAATVFFMFIAGPFGMPLEFSIILILPLHLAILAYTANWLPVAGVFLIYLGFLIAKSILSR